MSHIPVLRETAVRLWGSLRKDSNIEPGIYVDATFGNGGHSQFLLELPNPKNGLIVIGIDWDSNVIKKSKVKYQKYIQAKKLFLYQSNYTNIKAVVSSFQNKNKVLPVRGVLFDFGLCTEQLSAMRGFSFNEPEAPLDMRFDQEYNDLTATEILNEWPEEKLEEILRELGEERYARKVAKSIALARKTGTNFQTVGDLLAVLKNTIAPAYKRQKIHYATRTFQALRMAVNREQENIIQGLTAALDILTKKGRITAISFHSGEDRIVKNFFRNETKDCLCPPQIPQCVCQHRKTLKIITKKPLTPSPEEISQNPNARSAKLRAAEKM